MKSLACAAAAGAALAGCASLPPPEAPVTSIAPAPIVQRTESAPAEPAPAPPQAQPQALPATPAPQVEADADKVVVAPSPPPEINQDLWDRIRAGFAMPELRTPLVADKERFYLQQPEYLQRMFLRGSRYLYHIVEEIEKRGLPTELALLPFVESAMNPTAISSAKASGLWQFIPSTGKQYDLSQNWWVDNRRDVVFSTRAALDYLQKIHEMHGGDWFLALASYNWGENAVARAVKRNQARGLPSGYLHLNMPAETRHYVPKLIALKHIVLRSRELGVALPDLPNKPYFVTIEKTGPIDLKLAAQFAGMTVDEFVALNPAHNRPVIAASRNNEIKLPADRLEAFIEAVERHGQQNKPFASWQPYTIKPGESLADVARRGQVSVAELVRANDLRPNSRILPGTRILAPQHSVKDEQLVESFAGPRVYEQVTLPPVYYTVRSRDTAATIAKRHGISVADLKRLNGSKSFTPGTVLMVRQASVQTVLTTESGARRVIRASSPQPVKISNPAADGAPEKAPPSKLRTSKNATPNRSRPASTPAARSTPRERASSAKRRSPAATH